jgi:ABC-type transport system substrate-binding protein
MQYQQAQQMKKTNPEITEITYYATSGITLDPRNDKAPFNDIRVREALQMAIDLPTIASSYYLGTADPWPLPLTSNYMTGWGFPYSQWPQELKDEYAYNPTAAKKLLADAGYPNGFKTDVVVDSANDMDLLQIVKSYFTAIGVNMDIRPMDTASLTSFVTINHQNDALAERNTGTLSLSVYPLRHLSRLQTGSSANVAMVSDPIFDAFYTQAMNATSTDHVKQVLKDANEYVAQKHFVISLLAPNLFGFCQPWLKGYNAQTAAVSGPNGPLLLFFYGARYWIDQSVTKP